MNNERVVRLLAFLSDGAWNARPPRGVGPRTVEYCIERGWVRTKRLIIKRQSGLETFVTPISITKLGWLEHQANEEHLTGRMHPKLREHRLRELRAIIGPGVVRSLQLGASVLKRWRVTAPHNKWVENHRGKILWHSGEWSKFLPIDPFFEVAMYPDSAPELTIYRLKANLLTQDKS